MLPAPPSFVSRSGAFGGYKVTGWRYEEDAAWHVKVISSGLLADGSKIAAQRVGMANGDATGAAVASGSMYNNTMRDNLIGWACWQSSCAQEGYRKDQFFPAAPADYSTNSVIAARQITLDMENNEYQVWVNKMATAGVTRRGFSHEKPRLFF
jgi:hypothetical protein